MKKSGLLLLICMLVFACQPEEKLRPGRFLSDQIGRADLQSTEGVDYRQQIYFDLSSGEVQAQNSREVWDLALGCDPQQPNLFVNSAMLQAVAATGHYDFTAPVNPANLQFDYERADRFYKRGQLRQDFDSLRPQGQVFIIDLGRNLQNQPRGYRKLQILDFEEGRYRIRLAQLDNSEAQEITVLTDPRYNYVYLSFEKPGEVLKLEPPQGEWDLYFGRYMERLFDGDDTLDYSVTGCLLNPHFTEAYFDEAFYRDSSRSYNQLALDDVDEQLFSRQSNVIGHDWKDFDLDAGAFAVDNRKVYFVKDAAGNYYRLRFTGFFNNAGQKGAITFEYLPL